MGIFDRIGGPAAVTAAVDDFYRRVMADPLLAPYFDDIDMKRLKGHQRTLLAAAVGEPEPYPSTAAVGAQAPFDIRQDHFDLVVVHLTATLTDLGVDDATLGAIGDKLRPRRRRIASGQAARAS